MGRAPSKGDQPAVARLRGRRFVRGGAVGAFSRAVVHTRRDRGGACPARNTRIDLEASALPQVRSRLARGAVHMEGGGTHPCRRVRQVWLSLPMAGLGQTPRPARAQAGSLRVAGCRLEPNPGTRDFVYLRAPAFWSVPKPGRSDSPSSGKQGTTADTSSGSGIRWLTVSSAPILTESLSTTLVARQRARALHSALRVRPHPARARPGDGKRCSSRCLTAAPFRVGSEPSAHVASLRSAADLRRCAARSIPHRGNGNGRPLRVPAPGRAYRECEPTLDVLCSLGALGAKPGELPSISGSHQRGVL